MELTQSKQRRERRQRFYCHGGGHRFSEMAYSPLFGHHGSFKEYTQTITTDKLAAYETAIAKKTHNTSYIERFNLTLRQKISYLNRKTLGYCKNQKSAQWVMWINLFDYNYCQFHKSLRQDLTGQAVKFQRRYHHFTPAMKMGLTSTKLEWRDLIVAPLAVGAASLSAPNAHDFVTSTGL